jgi:hypothetical protein
MASAAQPVEPAGDDEGYECAHGCGFLGSYGIVYAHEAVCSTPNNMSATQSLEPGCDVALARENLCSKDAAACEAAVVLLGKAGTLDDVLPLSQLLERHADAGVRQAAAEAIGQIGVDKTGASEQAILDALSDPNGDVRATAAKAGARLSEQGFYASDKNGDHLLVQIVALFEDDLQQVRSSCTKACGRIFAARKRCGRGKQKKKNLSGVESTAASHAVALLSDADADVRSDAVSALGKLGSAAAAKAAKLVAKQFERTPTVRAVSQALTALNAVAQLEKLAGHPKSSVSRAAATALRSIEAGTDEDYQMDDKEDEAGTPAERIAVAKRRVRPRISEEWGVIGCCAVLAQAMQAGDVRDTLPRVNYAVVSEAEWQQRYAGTPQVVSGATAEWPARLWTEEAMVSQWAGARFRVGVGLSLIIALEKRRLNLLLY